MAAWLVSVKYAMDKRSEKVGALTGDAIIKIFNKATDLTKAFEYFLATGNLQSKTGTKLVLQLAALIQIEVTELMCGHRLVLCLFQFFIQKLTFVFLTQGLGLLQNTGLCVVADKLNFIRYLSHFRCVHRGASFAKMRTTTVRKLLPESWGFLCPVHTPDGEPCGLMNHMTAHSEIVTQVLPTTTLPALLCSLGK